MIDTSIITLDKQSLIILSFIEVDSSKNLEKLKRLLNGLNSMCPEMIIICGRIFTEHVSETESTAKFRNYLESLGQIIKDDSLINLRDHTEWVFVPSLEDPGQIKTLPCYSLSESMFNGFVGCQIFKIKKVTFATNPCRISFLGKEIVICRYNFMTRIKQNHHPKII